MDNQIIWVPGRDGEVSEHAVAGGRDVNGERLYIGRAWIEGDCVPGKIPASHRVIYVPYGNEEHSFSTYEYLIQPRKGKFEWKLQFNGRVPEDAVIAGHTKSGENLYVARTEYMGTLVIGKVHPSECCAFIPFAGREIAIQQYEVLVFENKSFFKEAKRIGKDLPGVVLRSLFLRRI